VVHHKLLGTAHSAYKLRLVGQPTAELRDAVRWGSIEPLPQRCRVAYRPALDSWNGNVRLRMTLEAVEG
jgi:single-stranded-DNA-specific exonuclease